MHYDSAIRDLRSMRSKEKNDFIVSFFCCVCLVFLSYLLYKSTVLLGFFDDDRGLVISLIRKNWKEILLEDYEIRFRPIFNLAISILWRASGCSTVTCFYMLSLLNCLLGILLFFASDYLFRNRLLSFAISAIYLASRHAYYQVMMLYGVMEGLALFFAMITLMCLLNYILNQKRTSFGFSILFYILAVFTHERYLALIVPILAAIWLTPSGKEDNAKPKIIKSIEALAVCGACILIRVIILKRYAWAGTGGSNMADTFSPEMIFEHILEQILYLFGWGATGIYLSGYSADMMTDDVTAATIIFDAGTAILLILFILSLIRTKGEGRKAVLGSFFTIVLFIGACIVSASTTIRVEMRWIYVSHAALLIGIGVLTTYTIHVSGKWLRIAAIILSIITLSSSFYVETAYRQGWKHIHFYGDMARGDSLTRAVMEYSSIKNRDLVIIDPTNAYEPEEIEGFLYLMDVRHKFIPRNIRHYMSIYQYQDHMQEDDVVLEYRDGRFRDVSGILFNSSEYINALSGEYYSDGWCTKEAEIEIIPFRISHYDADFFSNADLSGIPEEERTVHVSLNGKEIETFLFDGSHVLSDISLEMNKSNIISIQTGFSSPEVQRDGNELAFTVFFHRKEK